MAHTLFLYAIIMSLHLLHQFYASATNSYVIFCYSFVSEIHSVSVHMGLSYQPETLVTTAFSVSLTLLIILVDAAVKVSVGTLLLF
jgi:hypothetical protein